MPLVLVSPVVLAQPDGAHAFSEGNRLFRAKLYHLALEHYRRARAGGMSSPLLDYNMGVAYYRIHRPEEAAAAFERAAREPRLAPLAHYNLGLVARQRRDYRAASAHFRRAMDATDSRRLEAQAEKALAANQASRRALARISPGERRERRPQPGEPALGALSVSLKAGYGADDNVYRSPSEPYIDLSRTGQPLVTPEAQSGAFTPVELYTKYALNTFESEVFFVSYAFAGRFYFDEAVANADEQRHRLRVGSEYRRRENGRSGRIRGVFEAVHNRETYFDPDDGTERTLNGVSLGDRFDYWRYGPRLDLAVDRGRFGYGAEFRAQIWDYKDTELVTEYDHEFYLARLKLQYWVTRGLLARITGEYYGRYYGQRLAYDLNGLQLAGNEPLEYEYFGAGLALRQRLTRKAWAGVEYRRTERRDQFLGYNDYTRDQVSAELHARLGRLDLDAVGRLRRYDYPNAYAFNTPAGGPRELDALDWELAASYAVRPHIRLSARVESISVDSTDARVVYDRLQSSLGLTWEF